MATKSELQLLITAKDDASKKISKVGGSMSTLGATMKKVGIISAAAFTAFGVGAYKATQSAVDAQEIFNKFDVVFQDVSDGAERVAQDLRNNFGLAESSAKDLLSATGDMLTGFGMSGESALGLAEKTNKLAVDLASFTNIEGGAERASKALTKALLGERESVKELGIAILEEDVKAKVEAMEVAGKFTTETEREKKAIATLEIAFSQSKNAIGDFARTSDSAANRQRVLGERIKEVKESLGTIFLPLMEVVLGKMLEFTAQLKTFSDNLPPLGQIWSDMQNKVSEFFVETNMVWVFIRDFFMPIWESLKTTVMEAWAKISEAIEPIKPQLIFVAKLFGVVLLGAIMVVITVLAKAIEWTIKFVAQAVSGFGKLVKFLTDIFETWWLVIFGIIDLFKGEWEKAGEMFSSAMKNSMEMSKTFIASFVNFFIDGINKVIDGLNKIPKVDIGHIGEFKMKALGGSVNAGQPYIVGEHRPEMFVPSQSGNIKQLDKGSKEITVNFNNVNVRSDGDLQSIIEAVKKTLNSEQELYRIGAI